MYREVNYAFTSYDIELAEAAVRHYLKALMEANEMVLPKGDFMRGKPFDEIIDTADRLLSKLQIEMARQKASKEQLVGNIKEFVAPQ